MKRLDVRRECRCLAVRASTLGFLVIAACATLQVVAEAFPTRGLLDPRVRVAPYSTEQVYHLYGFVGYQIDLEFEPGETFLGLAAGDIKGLAFIAQDNHLFLKPKAASVGTNLTVLTSRRHYQFDYVALAHRPDLNVDEVIYALRFTYPPTPAATSTADRRLLRAIWCSTARLLSSLQPAGLSGRGARLGGASHRPAWSGGSRSWSSSGATSPRSSRHTGCLSAAALHAGRCSCRPRWSG